MPGVDHLCHAQNSLILIRFLREASYLLECSDNQLKRIAIPPDLQLAEISASLSFFP